MGLPRQAEARLFYRAAKQRFADAELLLAAGRTTGAVYLAGYTVECFLKALVLTSVTPRLRKEIMKEFRGARAHNIEWLRDLYRRSVGAAIARDVTRHLARVATWSTDLRYSTSNVRRGAANTFIESVMVVVEWADGRM